MGDNWANFDATTATVVPPAVDDNWANFEATPTQQGADWAGLAGAQPLFSPVGGRDDDEDDDEDNDDHTCNYWGVALPPLASSVKPRPS